MHETSMSSLRPLWFIWEHELQEMWQLDMRQLSLKLREPLQLKKGLLLCWVQRGCLLWRVRPLEKPRGVTSMHRWWKYFIYVCNICYIYIYIYRRNRSSGAKKTMTNKNKNRTKAKKKSREEVGKKRETKKKEKREWVGKERKQRKSKVVPN